MTTTTNAPVTATTSIEEAVPYTGDDWAQNLSRLAAIPMLLMGVMAVVVGLALGAAAGINLGDFFAQAVAADLGRGEALVQLSGAVTFLGMGFVLAGVVMSLVNVVRTLRDAGRDVQQSLGADAYKLRKPRTGQLTPMVMMTGVMIEIAAFGIGIFNTITIGDVNPGAIADTTTANGADLADIGTVRAISAWVPGLRFVGIAVLLVAVMFVLATIRKVLRFQAQRITELATQRS
ncbi:MAG TPA: hypothetical protein VMX12_12935 [Acidimicrobiia bacterium]|nr:hypothetical protein [Acidimicrobiia bacterium]